MNLNELQNYLKNKRILMSYVDDENFILNHETSIAIRTFYNLKDEIIKIRNKDFTSSNQIKNIKKLKANSHNLVIASCPAPFTALCEIIGKSEAFFHVMNKDSFVKEQLELIMHNIISYSNLLLKEGADLIWYDESYTELLSAEDYWNYSGEYFKKFLDLIDNKAILHLGKNIENILDKVLLTGIKNISINYNLKNIFFIDKIPKELLIVQNFTDEIFQGKQNKAIENMLINILNPYIPHSNVLFSFGNAEKTNMSIDKLSHIIYLICNMPNYSEDVNKLLLQIKKDIVDGEEEVIEIHIQKALNLGVNSTHILNGCLISGINFIGDQFKENTVFIPELLMASQSMYKGLDIIKPYIINKDEKNSKGIILIGTVEGDLHDIGKNLVAMMLESNFYKVINLGTNVTPQRFIENAKKHKVDIIALSALTTSTMEAMERTVCEIRNDDELKNIKIIVGGAPVSREFGEKINANGYSEDASEAVHLVNSLICS